jgi:tetratricopeptide (TPR) repeat protein
MRALRPLQAATAVALFILSASLASAQENLSVQKLLERGALEQAVQRADAERNPESTYLAAVAALKMNDNGKAAEQYGRLRDAGDESWKAVGESGARLGDGDVDGAMAAAKRAVAANGGNPYAHYQAGVVASRQGNHQAAMEAFGRAADLKPDLAYAHYYAGSAAQRVKQIAKMSEHFETFLKLAPDAPERAAVAALLRTLRPRR